MPRLELFGFRGARGLILVTGLTPAHRPVARAS